MTCWSLNYSKMINFLYNLRPITKPKFKYFKHKKNIYILNMICELLLKKSGTENLKGPKFEKKNCRETKNEN